MKRWLLAGTVSMASAFSAGCDETDAGSVKIKLKDDLSGSITAACLTVPASGPAEGASTGVTWQARGGVVASTGTFAGLGQVKVGDATFTVTKQGSATQMVLTLPRGGKAQWPGVLSVSAEKRGQAGEILDPDAAGQKRESKIGKTGKFEVVWPGHKVAAIGVDAKARGLSSDGTGDTATLIVPLDWARGEGEPIEWRITWE